MDDSTESDVYEMKFKCWNCFKEFNKKILKGRCARNNSGVCPYCGIKNSSTNEDRMHEVLSFVTPDEMKF